MRGAARTILYGFLIFTVTFDLLIFGAILHGSGTSSAISAGPAQTSDNPPIEYDSTDYMTPSPLVEQPFINSN